MATRKTSAKSTSAKATMTKAATTTATVNPVVEEKVELVKEPRKFAQNDMILCRSVTPGGLIINGRSGQKYVFSNVGDENEIEF